MRHALVRSVPVLAVSLALLATGCAINPATGKRQLVLIDESQEIQLGIDNDQQIVASLGLYTEKEGLEAYIQELGAALAAKSERPGLNWTFRVVDDPNVNAFALPGGYIYITRGILAHMNNEAELASVVGHEIGHVTARHGVNQMSKAQLIQGGFGLTMVMVPELQQFGDLAQQGLGLMFLKFSRDDERQADDLGLRYLLRGGYDPRPMPEMFEMLRRVGEAGGGGRVPGWMSTHPIPENRKERIEAQIAAAPGPFDGRTVDRAGFLGRIDGMSFGTDPREGYFRENLFLHPQMRFRLEFPAGWQTRNEKTVVMAVTPENDGVVQLELDPGETVDQALAKFFEPAEVQQGPAWRTEINGLPARSNQFAVTTEQGVLRGLVAFVEYDRRVYRLMGYTSEARWAALEPAVGTTIASFAGLTDRAAIDVQPARLKVVTARSATTLGQLAERNRASVPVETLAVINRLESADSPIPAGARVKLVVGGVSP